MTYVTTTDIRAQFSAAMSQMYQKEVPLYGDLLNLVADVNTQTLKTADAFTQTLEQNGSLERLSEERHGAIRLGSAAELNTMRQLFAVMGMHAVGYYDLSVAGIPVHSTAFRPIDLAALESNPFRVFTSLLRLQLIDDDALRAQAKDVLAQRQIFTPRLLQLIALEKQQSGLSATDATEFVGEALHTFKWHDSATVSLESYRQLSEAHQLIADIVCFKGPHINHLTPRTLDIDAAHQRMAELDMQPKQNIEGPPPRAHPILLRQTSFKALQERVIFAADNGENQQGAHTARFGEIEQRGVALTPKGRTLYDTLLTEATEQAKQGGCNYADCLADVFTAFPDTLDALNDEGLAYFSYCCNQALLDKNASFEANLAAGGFTLQPIVYEDFLPVSAAGIFKSNLTNDAQNLYKETANQTQFEADLGAKVHNAFTLYEALQNDSKAACLQLLNTD